MQPQRMATISYWPWHPGPRTVCDDLFCFCMADISFRRHCSCAADSSLTSRQWRRLKNIQTTKEIRVASNSASCAEDDPSSSPMTSELMTRKKLSPIKIDLKKSTFFIAVRIAFATFSVVRGPPMPPIDVRRLAPVCAARHAKNPVAIAD